MKFFLKIQCGSEADNLPSDSVTTVTSPALLAGLNLLLGASLERPDFWAAVTLTQSYSVLFALELEISLNCSYSIILYKRGHRGSSLEHETLEYCSCNVAVCKRAHINSTCFFFLLNFSTSLVESQLPSS